MDQYDLTLVNIFNRVNWAYHTTSAINKDQVTSYSL